MTLYYPAGPTVRIAFGLVALLTVLAVLRLPAGRRAFAQPAATSPIGTTDFQYNNQKTTQYGVAAADIVLKLSNLLVCRPPSASPVTYALCFYSGPAGPTGQAGNPALPCTLSPDGKSASCVCYKLTTSQSPHDTYAIDINGILNLGVYKSTVKACGHDGGKCSVATSATNPACAATDDGTMMPAGPLISVFSTAAASQYTVNGKSGTQACPAGAYAGCMTAPCADKGQTDGKGNALVTCQCPVVTGLYEIGQQDVPCNANAVPATSTVAAGSSFVWSASHNPKSNPGTAPSSKAH